VAVHLYANYSAVKALCLDTLNEDRLAIIVKNYMMNERIPEPREVNKEESVFLLKNSGKIKIILIIYFYYVRNFSNNLRILFLARGVHGFDIKIGVSFTNILKRNIILSAEIEFLLKFFENKKYIITIDIEKRNIFITLKKDIQPIEILEAYFYASMCAFYLCIARRIPIVRNQSSFISFVH